MRCLFGVALLWMALALGACASVPEPHAQRALYLDLRRIVDNESRADWLVDRVELEQIAVPVLRSTCQVTPEDRARLRGWLDAQLELQGGRPQDAFAQGTPLDDLDEALALHRVQMALDYGEAHRADCPFWLTPNPDFEGVQLDAGRFVILAESRGGGGLYISPSRTRIGGGGGGRVLPGWGVSERLTLAMGLEFGGQALISTSQEDQDLSTLVLVAAPFLVRLQDLSRVLDFEVAALSLTETQKVEPRLGVRGSVGLGVTTARVSAFLPIALLQVGSDFYPAQDDREYLWTLWLGTRFSLDVDP